MHEHEQPIVTCLFLSLCTYLLLGVREKSVFLFTYFRPLLKGSEQLGLYG